MRSDVMSEITLENFNENNRDRHIGNSLYRICRTEDKKKWYIHEGYNDGNEWCRCNWFYSESLQEVIDRLNSFKEEKEVIRARLGGC
jgi:hypothetical protein